MVVAYLEQKGLSQVDAEHFGATESVWMIVASVVVTLGLLFLSNKIKQKYGRK